METTAETLIDRAVAKAGSYEALGDRFAYEVRTLKRVRSGEVKMSDKMRALLERYLLPGPVEDSPNYGKSNVAPGLVRLRWIPVLSWAQAGAAVDFEAIPESWDGPMVEYSGRDDKAFGVELRGDSMEPKFSPGDIVIINPSRAAANGRLVVAKLEDEGIVFKLMHHSPDYLKVELASYNPLYPKNTYNRDQIRWMCPVDRVIKKLE